MTSKIRVLSDDTINKIAAGEVIENPASVVKELAENSLDAGATEIVVEIAIGGRQMIRISDNGHGMGPDDALLCLERHGTSKIRSIDDVSVISTMGFRGEAIPSIASISKFLLITTPAPEEGQASQDVGTMVVVDGGKLQKCCPAVRSPGTTIEIKSLFFNVPVRKKFQKSPAYDVGEIAKSLSALALANPRISFHLISDKETLFKVQGCEDPKIAFEERVKSILGSDFLDSTTPLDCECAPYRLKGLIGLPSNNRSTRNSQHLFINKRPVWSSMISAAVREGYGTTLPPNRYPVFVLDLQMISSLVDVNVHPQKREVRLRQEPVLRQLISDAVNQALQKANFSLPTYADLKPETEPFPIQPSFNFSHTAVFTPLSAPEPIAKPIEIPVATPARQMMRTEEKHEFFTLPQAQPETSRPALIKARVIATVPGYIILDPSSNQSLCLIEQRRAHHRVLYERLIKKANDRTVSSSQILLVPYTLEFNPIELIVLKDYLEDLEKLGFNMREFGKNTYVVDAIPSYFSEKDVETSIKALLNDLREERSMKTDKEKQLSYHTSHAIIKKSTRLSLIESQHLVDQLLQCQMPYQCPMGNPTHLFLTQEDLIKMF